LFLANEISSSSSGYDRLEAAIGEADSLTRKLRATHQQSAIMINTMAIPAQVDAFKNAADVTCLQQLLK